MLFTIMTKKYKSVFCILLLVYSGTKTTILTDLNYLNANIINNPTILYDCFQY